MREVETEILTRAFEDVAERLGVSILYTPVDDLPRAITAIRTNSERLQPYLRGPETAVCEYQVLISEVNNPQHGDIFTIINSAGAEEDWEFTDAYGSNDVTMFIALEREMK